MRKMEKSIISKFINMHKEFSKNIKIRTIEKILVILGVLFKIYSGVCDLIAEDKIYILNGKRAVNRPNALVLRHRRAGGKGGGRACPCLLLSISVHRATH